MNRRHFALAGLAVLPAAPTSGLAVPKQRAAGTKHKKRKIVTRTFSNRRMIKIPGESNKSEGPARPYPSTITVSGLRKGHILDVNLTLHGFSHDYPEDVDIMLVAPNGRAAIVMSEAGDGFPVNGLTIRLDDQAAASLPRSQALTNGNYRPTNHDDFEPEPFPSPAPQGVTTAALATFNGANPNGKWKLFVVDDADPDSGMIAGGWSLTIKARVQDRKRRT